MPDEPTGRLAQLIAETNLPEPYVISDKIAIQPLSKKGREKLRETETRAQMARLTLALVMQMQGPAPSDDELNALNKVITDAEGEYDRIFFGDQYDSVMEFFADRPPHLWDAFCRDIKKQFLPSLPATGRCQHCGNPVDMEQVGKDTASSI